MENLATSLFLLIFLLHCREILSACKDCTITACQNVNYRVPLDFDCSQPNLVTAITDICESKGYPVLPTYCAFFEVAGAMNDANNCELDGNDYTVPWCVDTCTETLDCIDEGFKDLARATGGWQECPELTKNGTLPCAVVNQSLIDKYSTHKPAALELECRRFDSPQVPPAGLTWYKVELGGFEKYLSCEGCNEDNLTLIPLPNTTTSVKIPLVDRPDASFSALFPARCSKYLSDAQLPAWGYWYIIWLIYSTFALGLLTVRRRFQPLASRNLFLVYYQCATIQIVLLPIYEIPVYQTTASCVAGPLFALAFGVAMIMSPLIIRAWHLYFLYRWNESKVDPNKSSWFFKHKYLLSTKSSLIAMALMHLEGLFVALLVYGLAPAAYKQGTVFASGRCKWFQITPELTAYAQSMKINLGPTASNPSGMTEWTVHYPSCQFCNLPSGLQTLVIFNGSIYLALVAISLWMLRNLNDQYALWKELVQVMICAIITFPLCWFSLNKHFFDSMEVYPGANLVWIIATVCLVWEFNASCVYPTLLTFKQENSGRGSDVQSEDSLVKSDQLTGSGFSLKVTHHDGEDGLNANVNNVLLDPLGVQAMQNFATEAFIAENIQYLLAMQSYSVLPRGEKKGKQAIEIYVEFIREGSRLELNISSSMRESYKKIFESVEKGGWGDLSSMDVSHAFRFPKIQTNVGTNEIEMVSSPVPFEEKKQEKSEKLNITIDKNQNTNGSVENSKIMEEFHLNPISNLEKEKTNATGELHENLASPTIQPESPEFSPKEINIEQPSPRERSPSNQSHGPPGLEEETSQLLDNSERGEGLGGGGDGGGESGEQGEDQKIPSRPQSRLGGEELTPHPELLLFSDQTFEDITKEVKMLVSTNWQRFLNSRHFINLIKNVTQRNHSLWDNNHLQSSRTTTPRNTKDSKNKKNNTSRSLGVPSQSRRSSKGGFLSPPTPNNRKNSGSGISEGGFFE